MKNKMHLIKVMMTKEDNSHDKVGTELDTKRKDLAGTIMTKEPEENTDGDNTQSTEIDD